MNTHKGKPIGLNSPEDRGRIVWELPLRERNAALCYEYARHCKPLLAEFKKEKPTIRFARMLQEVSGFPKLSWPNLSQRVKDELVKLCDEQLAVKAFVELEEWELEVPNWNDTTRNFFVGIDFAQAEDDIRKGCHEWLDKTLAEFRRKQKSEDAKLKRHAKEAAWRSLLEARETFRLGRREMGGRGSIPRKCEEYLRKIAALADASAEGAASKARLAVYENEREYSVAKFEALAMLRFLLGLWRVGREFVDPWRPGPLVHNIGTVSLRRPINYRTASPDQRAAVRSLRNELFTLPNSTS